jgi:hypothetical protein
MRLSIHPIGEAAPRQAQHAESRVGGGEHT